MYRSRAIESGFAVKKNTDVAASARAVILGNKERIGELSQILKRSYHQVALAETAGELEAVSESCRLAVMTDTFSESLTIGLINRVRKALHPEQIICLSEDDDQEKERLLRSGGLIFFGSYKSFIASAEEIINQTLTVRQRRVSYTMDPRKETLKALEKRLSGRSSTMKSLLKRITFRFSAITAEALARVIEWTVALGVTLFMTLPLLVILLLRKLFTGTPLFITRTISGAHNKPLKLLRFNKIAEPFCDLPLFFELFTGRLALAGRAINEWQEESQKAENAYISTIKPGIVSLWDIRRTTKTAHEGQLATEWEYIFKKHLFYDFMLMLRALPVMLYSEPGGTPPAIFPLLGLQLNNLTMEEAINLIAINLEQKTQRAIFFVNADCLNKMVSNQEYFKTLKSGDYIFPDGIGVSIAGKMLKTPLKENINGTDMLPYLCRMAAEKNFPLFLLGGKPGIAETAGKNISNNYGVTIAGTAHGYFDREQESDRIIKSINNSGAAILLVAFGAPLQEEWIARHRQELAPQVLMGVGGLFDFYSGTIKRAPRWIREIGFEWVYRILQEPGRMWQRYVIGNPLFLYRVIKWKVFTQNSQELT